MKQGSPPVKTTFKRQDQVVQPTKVRKNCGMNTFMNSLKLQKVNTGSDLDFDSKKKKKDGPK